MAKNNVRSELIQLLLPWLIAALPTGAASPPALDAQGAGALLASCTASRHSFISTSSVGFLDLLAAEALPP